jgi:nucleoside-diphosphate kinase
MMSDFIRMTGLLAGLREDFPCFWFELQRTWNGTAIAAVRESGAGPLHTVVTGDPEEMRTELATGTSLNTAADGPPDRVQKHLAQSPHPGQQQGVMEETNDWSWWTVILLKPDCLARDLVTPVLEMVGQHVTVVTQKAVYPTEEQVFRHYDDVLPLSSEFGVDVPAELRRIYLSHQVIVAIGHAANAAARLRAVLGPTDPGEADPATIRGRFGTDTLATARAEGRLINNLIHTSDHAGTVARDLATWFGPDAASLLIPPQPGGLS